MKFIAILSALVLLCAIIGTGYLYLTSNVTVEAVGVIAVEAATQPDLFERLKAQMDSGYVLGTPYTTSPLGDASEYQFYTYTLRLKNNCFVTADMVEVQVTPMDGDVMQLGVEGAHALPKRTTGDIQATILTKIGMHSVREINISYYMWGILFHLKTTYGY